LIIIFIIAILGVAVDRVTKFLAIGGLKTDSDIIVIKNFFTLSYLENRGAAFGIFNGKQIFLILITLITLVGIIIYTLKAKPKSKFYTIGIGMIFSGALGNLIDRAMYNYVVDFLQVHYKDVYYFPTFNVADCLVVVGTVVLAIYIIKEVE
jgi:signal peptidase II